MSVLLAVVVASVWFWMILAVVDHLKDHRPHQ